MLNNLAGIYGVGVPVSTNSYESIMTTTVGAGGASTISFTSIPSTYKHLQIRAITRLSTAGTQEGGATLRFNSDSGSNYSYHLLYGTGSATGAQGAPNETGIWAIDTPFNSNTSGVFGASVVDILDYADTNKYKTVRSLTGFDGNGNGLAALASGSWRNVAAINSIVITPPSGNFNQYSQLALYGIKG